MSTAMQTAPNTRLKLDYTLTGLNSTLAVEKGLAEAAWYQCPVPRDLMHKLLERSDGPALRNTALWFALIIASGLATWKLWGTWWAVVPYIIYSALYASTSDARWHETGHGTAFKTDWMNVALYEIASFMVMRESTVWRWSHTRHHSDTIIVGRDPEISVPRPADPRAFFMKFFALGVYPQYFRKILLHSAGRMTADESTYIPLSEFAKIYWKARVYVAVYASVIALSIYRHSLLPLMLIGFTNFFGTWLMIVYGLTQHAGLAENVLDHRLNCRTVSLNPVNRFLYWNMNYHIEHHMYPLVPFHALPKLHEAIKDDCPPPYPSLLAAWREIIPSLLKQVKDPAYHVKRELPPMKPSTPSLSVESAAGLADAKGWVDICAAGELGKADVRRYDHGKKTFALYRDAEGKLYATDGICTHGNVHLSEGLVMGGVIECSKHNGRFNLIDGSPARAPVCRGLATYTVQEEGGRIRLNIDKPGGAGARTRKTYRFKVVSNDNVATFIKELVLEPIQLSEPFAFTPGDYVQLDIPSYESIRYRDFEIPSPYAEVWERQHVFDLVSQNTTERRNNYSLASNQHSETLLRFNVRIATPPPGQSCAPGVGSSYIFSLKPGDIVTGLGPFGDFHIKPTQREMVYIGGGAGMAPLRAHLSHLLETSRTARKVSFWYGARSKQELFYLDYFKELDASRRNFSFFPALSSPLPQDDWTSHKGFIHEVVLEHYLLGHPNPRAVEYYLCGPPMMIKACTEMLGELGVDPAQVAFDAF